MSLPPEVQELHAQASALGIPLTQRQIMLSIDGAKRRIHAEVQFRQKNKDLLPNVPKRPLRPRGCNRPRYAS